MNWVSSRGGSPAVPFIDALFAGTAPDGGLYMPERLDPLSATQVDAIRAANGNIVEIGTIVGAHLLRDEITSDALRLSYRFRITRLLARNRSPRCWVIWKHRVCCTMKRSGGIGWLTVIPPIASACAPLQTAILS